jgi:tripartite-type tricarboxylate transporter receptor subunit TctC
VDGTTLKHATASALLIVLSVTVGRTQDYPTQPVRLVVPYAAGGGTDAMARYFAKGLEQRLGQPFIVENRGGSGTTLGAGYVARAAPDGYTIMLGTSSTYAIAISVYKKVPYDPTKDFAPIAMVAEVPFVLIVHPSLPVNSVMDLVRLAKSKPGTLNYASAGTGAQHHVSAELLKAMTGIEMNHVPYRGGGPALQDVVAGHIPIMFGDAGQVLPLVRAGKIKALAVTISRRLETMPDVPTMHEAGVTGYEASAWQAVVAPANTPAPIVAKLNKTLLDIVNAPETQKHFLDIGVRAVGSTPDELGAYIKSEIARWARVVEAAGATGVE